MRSSGSLLFAKAGRRCSFTSVLNRLRRSSDIARQACAYRVFGRPVSRARIIGASRNFLHRVVFSGADSIVVVYVGIDAAQCHASHFVSPFPLP